MACGCSRQSGRFCNQRHEQVRLIIRDHSLQHCRQPLQPRTGINRRLGQRIQLSAGVAVELHEHQIPDLDISAAGAAKGTIPMSQIGSSRTHVIVNLAARTAGAGIAHLPEVVFQAELEDAIFGYALADPQIVGLGIPRNPAFPLKDGDEQFVSRNPEPFV